MKYILFLVAFIFSVGVGAQQLPQEEINRLREFEGNQIAFQYDEDLSAYQFATQIYSQSSTNTNNPQIKLTAFIPIKQVDDNYCFGKIAFRFNLSRRGEACVFNTIKVAIGFPSNIKKGDAINYSFSVNSNNNGDIFISENEVVEILQKSIEMKRPLNFYFYGSDEKPSELIIPYAKVGQKFGGIIDTQKNLAEKFVICED